MSKSEIEIQLLADYPHHIPQLAQLQYEEISKHWVPKASIATITQRLTEHVNKNKLPLTLVALQDDHPIGMASLRKTDGIQPDLLPWLGSLVVDPHYRGNNVGKKLIDAVKKQAIDFGYKTLYLLAFDRTIPDWYKKIGWESIGTDYLFNHPVSVMLINL